MGGSLQVHLDGMHEHVCLSCIWENKETQHPKVTAQLRGFSVMITHRLRHLTVRTHQCIEL